MAERIVRSAAGDHMIGLTIAFEMLLVDIIGHDPSGIPGLCYYRPRTDRGLPVETAEPNRKRVDHGCDTPAERRGPQLPPMTNCGRRRIKVVEPHFGDIQHHADTAPLG